MLDNLKSDQHCILFTSQPNIPVDQLYPMFQTMHLTTSLRSTVEIARFANNWVQFYPYVTEREAEIKHGHNFYGENPDIRFVSRENLSYSEFLSYFVQKSADTIIEYAKQLNDLSFLPVIVYVQEETINHVRKSVQQQYDQISKKLIGQHLPQPQFYNFIETEGIEFPVAIVLMCSFNYYDEWSGIREWFLTAITRATTKLVIVHNNEHIDESTGLNEFTERDPGELGPFVCQAETNGSKAVIVGSDYNYPLFLSPSIQSLLQLGQSGLPNVKGIKWIWSCRGVRFLQIDDLFKEEDIKELLRIGVTSVIIVGGRNRRNVFNWIFYKVVQNIMESVACLDHFRVINLVDKFHDEADSKGYLHAFLLHQVLTNPKLSRDQLKKEQEIISNETPDLEKASCKWQTWKAKGNQLYYLELPHKALEMYTCGEVLLKRQIDISTAANDIEALMFWSNELAKTFTNKSKMWIQMGIKYWQAIDVNQVPEVFVKKFSAEYCIAHAALDAFRGVLFNIFWERSNSRLMEVRQLLKANYLSKKFNLGEQYVELKKRIKEEHEQKFVFRLRNQELKPAFNDHLNNCVSLIQEHRREYNSTDPKNVINLIRQRRKLAEKVSNEIQLYFKEIIFDERDNFKKIVWFFCNYRNFIEISMEVLEWNPFDETVRAKLSEFLEFIIRLMLDIQSLFHRFLEQLEVFDTILIPREIWKEMLCLPIFVWFGLFSSFDSMWTLVKALWLDETRFIVFSKKT